MMRQTKIHLHAETKRKYIVQRMRSQELNIWESIKPGIHSTAENPSGRKNRETARNFSGNSCKDQKSHQAQGKHPCLAIWNNYQKTIFNGSS